MVEPQHKRVKLPPVDRGPSISNFISNNCLPMKQLQDLYSQLCTRCLCKLPLSSILHTMHQCNIVFSQPHELTQNVEGSLLYASLLSLFFEVALKQRSKGIICSRISEVVLAGADTETDIIAILFNFLAEEDKYISYGAMRALVSLLLIMQPDHCELVMRQLGYIMQHSTNTLELGHAFEVVRKIIEHKDVDEHPLDNEASVSVQPPHCKFNKHSHTEVCGANEIKYIAIKTLEAKWYELISRFPGMLRNYSLQSEHVIVSFLSLWEALVSVKNNLNVKDTKEFFYGLDILVTPLLSRDTPLIVWSNIVNLFNEVLCYGSTLALQEVIAEEPCNLAHSLIRAVNVSNLLEFVPCGQSAEENEESHMAINNHHQSSHNGNTFRSLPSQVSRSETNKEHLSTSFEDSVSSSDHPASSPVNNHSSYSVAGPSGLSSPNILSPKRKTAANKTVNNTESFHLKNGMDAASANMCEEHLHVKPKSSLFMSGSYSSLCAIRSDSVSRTIDQSSSPAAPCHSTTNIKSNSTSLPIMDICASLRDVLSPKSKSSQAAECRPSGPTNTLEQSINGLQILQNCYDDDDEDSSSLKNLECYGWKRKPLCDQDNKPVAETNDHKCNEDEVDSSTPEPCSSFSVNSKGKVKVANNNRTEVFSERELFDMGADESEECLFSSAEHRSVVVFHKVVLLILKAIAVTVLEARGEASSSSSENSSSGTSETEEMDMEIIGRSLKEVMLKLDSFVKSRVPYHPECSMAEWLVRLFASQDDWMVEAMVCGLDIHAGLGDSVRGVSNEVQLWLDPHTSFITFLNTVCFDHTVLLDLLVSNETCFLLYLLRYLKVAKKSWASLLDHHSSSNTRKAVSVMFRLRLAIDKLVSKNLFPYNISPVLRLLDQCYQLFGDASLL